MGHMLSIEKALSSWSSSAPTFVPSQLKPLSQAEQMVVVPLQALVKLQGQGQSRQGVRATMLLACTHGLCDIWRRCSKEPVCMGRYGAAANMQACAPSPVADALGEITSRAGGDSARAAGLTSIAAPLGLYDPGKEQNRMQGGSASHICLAKAQPRAPSGCCIMMLQAHEIAPCIRGMQGSLLAPGLDMSRTSVGASLQGPEAETGAGLTASQVKVDLHSVHTALVPDVHVTVRLHAGRGRCVRN